MKHYFLLMIMFACACVCNAQELVNVKLEMNGKFGNRTEAELKTTRGTAWANEWETNIKPAILNDMIQAMSEKNNKVNFGIYDNAKIEVLFSLVNMDDDGETTAFVSCTYTFNDGTTKVLFCKEVEKDGDNTKNFTRITSKALTRIASSVASKVNLKK